MNKTTLTKTRGLRHLRSAALSGIAACTAVAGISAHAEERAHIAGIYPHLAMTNGDGESGVGAVVPWADRLWVITYAPHSARGSRDKLYEITPDLEQIIRPESVGGTPANRLIHKATNQLNIGPYFIDAERNVRALSPRVAQGRLTGSAAHLTDPNRMYIYTMESGLYDVDARDLSVIVRYPDVQNKGDRFIHGYHGKGAYSGQGLLAVSNNGRMRNQGNPRGPAGVLATWDGRTVADNGGQYTDDWKGNDRSQGPEPRPPQPHFVAGWNHVSRTQHCEITGPGGIYGSSNPETDPIWSTGWDDKSVLLHVLENREWNLWRLPKGSYTHDGSHGWHVEWPRIRQLDPADPDSIYLMHMHGLFYDFPKTFGKDNFGGLQPLSSYYKMPTDYAMFNGRIVMGKNDTSKFGNPLALRNQSNLWFGELETIKSGWGAPMGFGAVWKDEDVAAGAVSDPFLVQGFAHRTLHLRNKGNSPMEITLESSQGTPEWKEAGKWSVPANGYLPVYLSALDAQWVRLVNHNDAKQICAFFHMYSPYRHSEKSSEFAALPDIDDSRPYSDGVIRLMAGADMRMEFASSRPGTPQHRYHQVAVDVKLNDVEDATAEESLRKAAELKQGFGSDEASVWVTHSRIRYRLPRTHAGYDEPFIAGWARGEREVVTERSMLNVHGTFYELPRLNSGGIPFMRPMTTHGKKISDFATWRGLFVLAGVLDEAPASNQVVKNADGSAALWFGEIDDLWRMGEPRGYGGPWKDTEVDSKTPSDPYIMIGYNRKELSLHSTKAANITVQIDFFGNGDWADYKTFELGADGKETYLFPEGFHAHWIRFKSSAPTKATAQLKYGPVTP